MARLRETITDLERQLHAVRSRIEGETELHAAVVRQQRQAEELAHIARLVNETLDLTTVSERIVESVLGLLRVSSSAIRLLQPDGSLKALALGGRAKDYPANRESVPAGVGLVGRAAAEGCPMWTEDVLTDARFVTNLELRERNAAFGIVSGVAVPLRVTGRVIGVLSVGNSTRRVFTEAEIDLLQTLADQAAIAISNAQNQEALAKQAERLRILHEIDRALLAEQAPEAIAEAAVRPLRELLGIPRVIVNIFDLEAGQVYWLAAAGRRRSYLGLGRPLFAEPGRRHRGPQARRAAAPRRRCATAEPRGGRAAGLGRPRVHGGADDRGRRADRFGQHRGGRGAVSARAGAASRRRRPRSWRSRSPRRGCTSG